jgi:DNA-binding CsgD family transcriptional regulator
VQRQRAEQINNDIIRLCHAGLDSRTLRTEIIKRLRKLIPIDASFFTTADPATLLFTGAVADEILTRATPQFIENEFLQDDVNKFSWLAKNLSPVGALLQATERESRQSLRYRDILAPLSLGDELRAALIVSGACWGFMCLHRDLSSPRFTPAEIAFINRLAPHIAEGLRTALLLGSMTKRAEIPDEPGLLILADDLSMVAITPAAERWLAEVAEAGWTRTRALPTAIYAVVARLLAIERGDDPNLPMSKARLRTASGQWLTLHASRLTDSSAQTRIAVIFEVARPTEITPLIAQAYNLSKRESEIIQTVLRGASTAEMVATFRITSNTVQDHLKAIFEKVGVRSRRELVGQIFAEQYQPRILSGCDVAANGWFTSTATPVETLSGLSPLGQHG